MIQYVFYYNYLVAYILQDKIYKINYKMSKIRLNSSFYIQNMEIK